ncbi:MAG: hypothetical protein IKD58_02005 [Loktanella sp.]|nr:hypothetical protein [Loktanella sp.]
MKGREKLHAVVMEEAGIYTFPPYGNPSLFGVVSEIDCDPNIYLGGGTLPAFTHGEEGTISHYRRKVEKRSSLCFTDVAIDQEYSCICIILDDDHHLSKECGVIIDDYRFLFEIRFWLFVKTGCEQFLYVDYLEQSEQMLDEIKLELYPKDYGSFA